MTSGPATSGIVPKGNLWSGLLSSRFYLLSVFWDLTGISHQSLFSQLPIFYDFFSPHLQTFLSSFHKPVPKISEPVQISGPTSLVTICILVTNPSLEQNTQSTQFKGGEVCLESVCTGFNPVLADSVIPTFSKHLRLSGDLRFKL